VQKQGFGSRAAAGLLSAGLDERSGLLLQDSHVWKCLQCLLQGLQRLALVLKGMTHSQVQQCGMVIRWRSNTVVQAGPDLLELWAGGTVHVAAVPSGSAQPQPETRHVVPATGQPLLCCVLLQQVPVQMNSSTDVNCSLQPQQYTTTCSAADKMQSSQRCPQHSAHVA